MRPALLAAHIVLGLTPFLATPASAQVVITEIMYRAASDLEGDDYLEIQNVGGTAQSLAGWCIEGVDFCFPAGASIAAGERQVIVQDEARFSTTYGITADHVYAGTLRNSGERLALVDAVSTVRDEVVYSDVPPWPVTPDGTGPSLEVIDPQQDNATPRNWRACTAPAGHTARAVNSVAATGLPPWISQVSHPVSPPPGPAIVVTARVEDATAVTLYSRIGFAAETSAPMRDDGASDDGAAGDGIYGTTIPGQPAATLVRFRIEATGPTGAMSHPRTDDTVQYAGTATADPDVSSQLPIVHWFMDPADYDEAIAHKYTDATEPAVIVYEGTLYDAVQVRVRGNTSRDFPKNNWKVYFPRGHSFFAPGLFSAPVDDFDLQGSYADKSYLRELLGWGTFQDAGVPYQQILHVRVQQNGGFYGLYLLLEDHDGDWLARSGLDENGADYEANDDLRNPGSADALRPRYEKHTRLDEDYQDLYDLVYGINNLSGAAQKNYLLDNVDLPAVMNFLAATVLIHNNDHVKKNYFVYRDTEGTGRWRLVPWDLDLTFGRNYDGTSVLNDEIWADLDVVEGKTNVSPSHPQYGDLFHQKIDFKYNRLTRVLHGTTDFRTMFYRRLRTLMDELLVAGGYEATIDAVVPTISAEAELDRQRWGQYGQPQSLAQAVQIMKDDYLAVRRTHLFTTHRVAGEIPPAQSANPRIVINEIMYAPPGGTDHEYVELFNPSTTESVDLSGWRLDGLGLRIPNGAVILPRAYAMLVKKDVAFRAAYGTGRFVAGEYSGDLSDAGELLVLRDRTGTAVASVAYENLAPWPAGADGQGASLELRDAAQENGWVSNWAASAASGGSPGLANGAAGSMPPFPRLYVNELLPANATINLDEAGDRDPWIEIHNGSSSQVDLGGYRLSDDLALPAKWTFPGGTLLCAGCFLIVWADEEPTEGPLHASFRLNPTGGLVALSAPDGRLTDYLRHGSLSADSAWGRYPDGTLAVRGFARPTPGGPNDADPVALVLNEYNAVDPDMVLKNGAADTYWGPIVGNGGDWFELVVTADRLDARGWQLVMTDDPAGPTEVTETLLLSNDPVWSDLRSGTIITISEGLADDVSFDPEAGDWWINVRAADGAPGTYVSPESFPVSNKNWQLTIRNALGEVVFGPVGEGISPPSGVGNDEVCKLEEDPRPHISEHANYRDGTSSTFGAPNRWSGGSFVQDFAPLRCEGLDCDALDGACVLGACDGGVGQCVTRPRENGVTCNDGNACTGSDVCQSGTCLGTLLRPPLVPGLTVAGSEPTTLTWSALGSGVRYDVAGGTIADLVLDGGVAGAGCLANDLTTPTHVDSRPAPPAGSGYYYIVRSQNACAAGSYGSSSVGSERVPASACP